MPFLVDRGAICVLATVVLCLTIAAPLRAQQFDFDNIVMLSNLNEYPNVPNNDVWGFVGTDGHEYIMQLVATGSAFYDVDDPVNPVFVKFIAGPGSLWRDAFVIGNYAYVVSENETHGIQVIDISTPTDPQLVTTYTATVGNTHNVFGDASRDLLFTVGGYKNTANGGMQVFDVSDPMNIVEIGQWDNKYVHDMSIEGNIVYACLIGDDKLRPLDITDATNPVNWGKSFGAFTAVHASWPIGDNRYILLTEEQGGGHLKSIDFNDNQNPVLAAAHNPAPGSSAHNVHVEGSRAYISWYARGTRVYDVSDPTNLVEIAWFDTYPPTDAGGVGPGNWGVYPHLPSGIIASNGDNGLFLLQYEPNVATMDGNVTPASGSFFEPPSVTYQELSNSQSADETTGYYKFSGFSGATNTLTFSAFGFESDTVVVSTFAGGTTTTNVSLTQLAVGSLSGAITDDNTALPIQDVEIEVAGTPLFALTDASGGYSFPSVPVDDYTIRVRRYGYVVPEPDAVTITSGNPQVRDYALVPAPVYEDFSAASNWTVDNDPLTTTGFWEFADPFPTAYQPGDDHTIDPDVQCAVTGAVTGGGAGGNDVDGGATRLLSPTYNLSSMTQPRAFYYRWYGVNSNVDKWQVEVTTNGGASWDLIESSADDASFWMEVDIDLTPFVSGATAVQFRFTAEDPDPGQVVEAALDDFTIYDGAGTGTDVHLPALGSKLRLELAQNFPNPFPSETKINFTVPQKGWVELSIYDVRGARVATLIDGELEPGAHFARWDGRALSGKKAAAGVYFYKLSAQSEIRTRKMLRLN